MLTSRELDSIRRRAFTGKLVMEGETASSASLSRTTPAPETEASRKAARKAASVEKASKWKDTLAAQRVLKEQSRARREEEAEAARRVLDKEVRASLGVV
jgi:hypothetical protein